MSGSAIITASRLLLATMQPMTGERASGTVTAQALTGQTISIPRNTHFLPIVDGRRRPDLTFKTAASSAADEAWIVDDSGTSTMNLISVIGGVRHNLPAGTIFVPDEPVDGLDFTALPTATADFAGATQPASFGGIQDAAVYESFDPQLYLDLRRSTLAAYPGVLIAFEDMQPADGTTVAQTIRETRAGTRRSLYKATFTVSVISSRADEGHARRLEGLVIADELMRRLTDRQAVDGCPMSNPSGIQIRQMFAESGPQPVYQKWYIYTIRLSLMITLQQVDERVFNDWLCAVIAIDKPDDDLGPIRVVDDYAVDMSAVPANAVTFAGDPVIFQGEFVLFTP